MSLWGGVLGVAGFQLDILHRKIGTPIPEDAVPGFVAQVHSNPQCSMLNGKLPAQNEHGDPKLPSGGRNTAAAGLNRRF